MTSAHDPLFLLHCGHIDSDGEQDRWDCEADSGARVDEFARKHPGQTVKLYAHPAPAVADSVATVATSNYLEGRVQWAGKRFPVGTPLYTAAPAVVATEVVAWRVKQGGSVFFVSAAEFIRAAYDYGEFLPLYGRPAPEVAAEPALWQYRWANPGNNPDVSLEDMEWREVAPDRIEELRAYRYDGKPIYEVRALYAHPAPAVADSVATVATSNYLEGRVQWAGKRFPVGTPLYTAAPAVVATVQPLTPEKIDEIYRALLDPVEHWALARAIERACAGAWGVKLAAANEEQK